MKVNDAAVAHGDSHVLVIDQAGVYKMFMEEVCVGAWVWLIRIFNGLYPPVRF